MRRDLFVGFLLMATATATQAQTPAGKPVLDAVTSDPATMGWMQGSPPAPDKRIERASGDHLRFPMTRWSFSHMREFVPTQRVSRGPGTVWTFPRALRDDIDSVSFTPLGGGAAMSWRQSLDANFTDSILVLHQGRVVYERYFGVSAPDTRHIAFSVTKSFVGTLAEMLIAEGKLDETAPVSRYLPELAASGFGSATVRQVADMTTALDYSEDYTDSGAGIADLVRANGYSPRPPGYAGPRDIFAYLPTVHANGPHGAAFTYRTVNTEVLGWLVARASGKRLADVLSERLWQPLGMACDADWIAADPTGAPFAGGGLNPCLGDLARFGEAMRLGGKANGQQVIPAAVVARIAAGGKREDFARAHYPLLPGWSYRSQWWVSHNPHGAWTARGIHGQAIYIDPVAEMVVARFASNPVAANSALDPTSLPAYHALAEHLMRPD